MKPNVIETIRYLNSADGPNIPLRTLGAYCGVSCAILSMYLNDKATPRPEKRKQLEQGIKELMTEIYMECKQYL